MKAIILAAAKSKKLLPFSETRPKSMIFISGQYILETILNQLIEAGVHEIWIVVNHKKEIIQNHFQYGKALGVKLDYIIQPEENGIGHAVSICEKVIGGDDRFLLVFGDALMVGNPFRPLIERYERTKSKALATITHPASEGSYGNVYLSHNMKITKLLEKPSGARLSNYIFGGSFILPGDCFSYLKENKLDMVSFYQHMIKEGSLEASLWEDSWIDISRPWYILEANRLMMQPWTCSKIPQSVTIGQNVNISGVVHIEENVYIGSGTNIVGPCYIGSNVYIGNNSLIRKNASIGPNSSIGYGTEVKNSVLFGNSTVGRLSFIGDSVLGEGVQFGSGTMTLNYNTLGDDIILKPQGEEPINTHLPKLGAFIGDQSIIGTGHTISPGALIPQKTHIKDHITLTDKMIQSPKKSNIK